MSVTDVEKRSASGAVVRDEAARRRTFAVISHPDAGKSTLTEALALHAAAINTAGAVHGKAGRRGVTSDWMAMEKDRGISITSAVLKFDYDGHVLNLLDTPGHADFSEDTYRVLEAVDCAIMLLDSAKGLEPQTLKLFDVCRSRHVPVVTFVNKWDRPGREPLELLDEIEQRIGLRPTPVNWPVGIAGDFRGLIERATGVYTAYTRHAGRGRAGARGGASRTRTRRGNAKGAAYDAAAEELALLDEIGAEHRHAVVPGRGVVAGAVRGGAAELRGAAAARRDVRAGARALAAANPWTGTSGRWRRRSPAWCSRCRPTWTLRTGTGSRSCGSPRGGSSAGWCSRTPRPGGRSPPSTRRRCSGRSGRRSRSPTPVT